MHLSARGESRSLLAISSALLLGLTALAGPSAGASDRAVRVHVGASLRKSLPTTPLGPGDYKLSMTVGTMTRTLILHVPTGPTVPNRPLVLVYHGNLDTAAATIKETNFEQASNKSGYLVAFLQGYSNSWDNIVGSSPSVKAHIDDVGFTTTAITTIAGLAPFDLNRVAAVGFSAGALMVEYLGCALAGKLALIVPVEGELPVTIASSCAPSRAISVYEIHGTADTAIPYNGGYFHGVYGGTTVLSAPASAARWAQLDQCRSTPSTTYPSPSIKLTSYSACSNGTTAVLRTIIGGGHVWGSNIGQLVAQAIPAGL